MARDTVQQLVLDHSATDFSGAANYAAAVADADAQTGRLDCQDTDRLDILVELTALGSGPVTQINITARYSAEADPDVTSAVDWAAISAEDLDATTGASAIVRYEAQLAVSAVGQYSVTVPVRGRYMSAIVWVDSASGSRGTVSMYRREE